MIAARPAPSRRQRTLAAPARVAGVGLFTGAECRVTLRPAAEDAGVRFRRVDRPGRPEVAAAHAHLAGLPRRTGLVAPGGDVAADGVQMVEHLMAALAGLRVDNCLVEVDGPELPGLDGSAAGWVRAVFRAGVVAQSAPRPTLTVARRLEIRGEDGALVRLDPPARPGQLEVSYFLDHPHPAVGRRHAHARLTPGVFANLVADARTFVTEAEVAALRAAGFGARVTAADLCVFADRPTALGVGPGGLVAGALRGGDEPARHKLLDVVGDLALIGCDLAARVTALKSGHRLNHAAAGELLATHAVHRPGMTPPLRAAA